MTTDSRPMYVSVILPLKFRGEASYSVPPEWRSRIRTGSRIRVDFSNKEYPAVVEKILPPDYLPNGRQTGKTISCKDILKVEEIPPVREEEIRLWRQMADYYLCTPGEIFKAAYPPRAIRQETVKARKTAGDFFRETATSNPEFALPQLSPAQEEARRKICRDIKKPVLLQGVTGSGKTEIYITLAAEMLKRGRNVLYMVPEIAVSRQLQQRLKKVFGERLLTFHSQQTAAEKARIHKILSEQSPYRPLSDRPDIPDLADHPELPEAGDSPHLPDLPAESGNPTGSESKNEAVIVLGTRSSLLLPYGHIGLVIVDEEHDPSYKQTEPAPRYHARDTAVMLASIHSAPVLLGSATPSFESEYNCRIGRFRKVLLTEKYYGSLPPEVEIIDTLYARKTGQMRGSFSQKLINRIRQTLDGGEQVLIFRNRRSYAPLVECTECGYIPKCPHCNVYLSYHKHDNTLRCHYCEHTAPFRGTCPSCGLDTLRYKGAGTEKLEEELGMLFPDNTVARFDADITRSKRAGEQVLKSFADGRTDLLVGTQMLSKGFDFERLGLVAVIQADTLLGLQDFRTDERALQLLNQLMGRTGRRGKRGSLIVQTNQKDHPVLQRLLRTAAADGRRTEAAAETGFPPKEESPGNGSPEEAATAAPEELLAERQEYLFPPFVRMVKVTARHKDPRKLEQICRQLAAVLPQVPCRELTGPFAPPVDRIRGEWLQCFCLKFTRDARLAAGKNALLQAVESLKAGNAVFIDVDPLG